MITVHLVCIWSWHWEKNVWWSVLCSWYQWHAWISTVYFVHIYYKVKFHRTIKISPLPYSSAFIEGLPNFFPVCDRNSEVPGKFAYRNPNGMLSLHSAHQKTIVYENFYLLIHTASFSRTSYGK